MDGGSREDSNGGAEADPDQDGVGRVGEDVGEKLEGGIEDGEGALGDGEGEGDEGALDGSAEGADGEPVDQDVWLAPGSESEGVEIDTEGKVGAPGTLDSWRTPSAGRTSDPAHGLPRAR